MTEDMDFVKERFDTLWGFRIGKSGGIKIKDNNLFITREGGCLGCPETPLLSIITAAEEEGILLATPGKDIFFLDPTSSLIKEYSPEDLKYIEETRGKSLKELGGAYKESLGSCTRTLTFALDRIKNLYLPKSMTYVGVNHEVFSKPRIIYTGERK